MQHLYSPLIALLLWAATLHVAYAAPPAPTESNPVYYLDLEARRSEASHLLSALSPDRSGTDVTAQVYAGTLTTVELGVGLAATADIQYETIAGNLIVIQYSAGFVEHLDQAGNALRTMNRDGVCLVFKKDWHWHALEQIVIDGEYLGDNSFPKRF